MGHSAMPKRGKRSAARRSYKLSLELLASLSAMARFEHRSDTAQLEMVIRDGMFRWLETNPMLRGNWKTLRDELLADLVKKANRESLAEQHIDATVKGS